MVVAFDNKVFSVSAVLATAYWCADRMVADIRQSDDGLINVDLKRLSGEGVSDADVNEFKLMLVHNQIRNQLSEKFSALETAIVEKAFAPVRSQQ